MKQKWTMKRLLALALIVLALLAVAVPAFAQEATPEVPAGETAQQAEQLVEGQVAEAEQNVEGHRSQSRRRWRHSDKHDPWYRVC